MGHRDALNKHLASRQPGESFTIAPIELKLGDWSFFEGTQDDTRDGETFCWVVRPDGTVVTDKAAEELGRIYRSVSLVAKPEGTSTETVAHAALCLFAQDVALISGEDVQEWNQGLTGDPLAAPAISRSGKGVRLVFWDRSMGRNLEFTRHEVEVSIDYAVSHKQATPSLSQKHG